MILIDGCDAEYQNRRIYDIDATGDNPAKQFVCEYHCFDNDTIIVRKGSVVGIMYDEIKQRRGQMLAINEHLDKGICVGSLQYSFGVLSAVKCPTKPSNISTVLLASASIGKYIC